MAQPNSPAYVGRVLREVAITPDAAAQAAMAPDLARAFSRAAPWTVLDVEVVRWLTRRWLVHIAAGTRRCSVRSVHQRARLGTRTI